MASIRVFIGALVLTFFSCHAEAKELYNVQVSFTVKGMESGENAMVAYYLGGKQYIKDTIQADAGGNLVFTADTANAGLYMLVFPSLENQYFEFILNEKRFSIQADKADLKSGLTSSGSLENSTFFSYVKFLAQLQEERQIVTRSTEFTEKEKAAKSAALFTKVKEYQLNLANNLSSLMVGKLVRASMDIEIPEPPKEMDEAEVKNFRFRYYRRHFFDFVDWETDYLVYSPILYQKIETYLERLTVAQPDSVIVSVDQILDLCQKNEEVQRFATTTLLNKYAKSKAMCFDKVYVHIALQYYGRGKAPWVDEVNRQKILDRATTLKPTTCGEKAPNFTLTDVNNKQLSLHSLPANWTVLIFWKNSCGNCIETIKALKELKESETVSFNILAVSASDDEDEWKRKIAEYNIGSWYNVSNHAGRVNFKSLYDLTAIPKIYLLDKNKEIVAKQIGVDDLGNILERSTN